MSSSSKSPVYPMPEHFSDYGFDPHFDYFKELEEARSQQSEDVSRSIDSLRFKLRKPTPEYFPSSTPYNNNNSDKKKRKTLRWWNKALRFFKCTTRSFSSMSYNNEEDERDVHAARARELRAAGGSPISGPLYMTETRARYTPPRYGGQALSVGVMSPVSGCNSPYLSLRELNMERQHFQRMSASASPVYMVT